MRKQFRNIAAILTAMTVALVGCSKEDPGTDKEKTDGKAMIQLRVHTESSSTRAAESDTEEATAEELALATKLFVVVYDGYQDLETYEYLSYTTGTGGVTNTEIFTVTTGEKYFFVISDPAGVLSNDYTTYTPPSKLVDFQKQIVTAASADALETADASTNKFINATLWPKRQMVETTTTTLNNEIGRIVGKVHLKPFADNNQLPTNMLGTYSAPKYRLGGVALDNLWIGKYEGTIAPPAFGHGQVISASYEYSQNTGTTGLQNPKFAIQSTLKTPDASTLHYVNENTTKPDAGGYIYYGNTTYIQFQAIYTPHSSEICKGTDGSAGGTLTDNTFWTGYIAGALTIFDSDPRGNNVVDDDDDVKYYLKGYNMYNFPIRDRKEDATALQCRIIRNHYYEVTINSINHLGEPLSDPDDPDPDPDPKPVDPEKPIDVIEVELDLEIRVLKWAKVSQGEIL